VPPLQAGFPPLVEDNTRLTTTNLSLRKSLSTQIRPTSTPPSPMNSSQVAMDAPFSRSLPKLEGQPGYLTVNPSNNQPIRGITSLQQLSYHPNTSTIQQPQAVQLWNSTPVPIKMHTNISQSSILTSSNNNSTTNMGSNPPSTIEVRSGNNVSGNLDTTVSLESNDSKINKIDQMSSKPLTKSLTDFGDVKTERDAKDVPSTFVFSQPTKFPSREVLRAYEKKVGKNLQILCRFPFTIFLLSFLNVGKQIA
jgi:hypothetical protein